MQHVWYPHKVPQKCESSNIFQYKNYFNHALDCKRLIIKCSKSLYMYLRTKINICYTLNFFNTFPRIQRY
jgi:hypothetical protein